DITVTISGYSQTVSPAHISSLTGSLTGQNITLTALYTVSLTKGDGISGFEYSINDGGTFDYEEPFETKHGDTLIITALPYEEYAFVSWSSGEGSSVQDSKENPLTVSSVSGNISLTANGELIEHYVEFDSGSNYTVYVNGSPVSEPIKVIGKGNVVFTVNTPEGYTAVPDIKGIVVLAEQQDESYRISEIYSNVSVTVTVTADGGNDSGKDSGNGNGSDNGNDSRNDSGIGNTNSADSISSWIPILIVGVFLACIAVALIGHTFVKHRKNDREGDSN
ncbi:MAG: hypothetical protein LBJ20_00275, partial [Candidatus Methanoplasma sp.]|nr:hypothetical protein [Candidatus Methanoplasma sp.]